MSELGILGELVKGGTTAGLLMAVGWVFLNRLWALIETMRKANEEALRVFHAEMAEERKTHRAETEMLSAEFAKLTGAMLSLTKETTELRRDIRRDFSGPDDDDLATSGVRRRPGT